MFGITEKMEWNNLGNNLGRSYFKTVAESLVMVELCLPFASLQHGLNDRIVVEALIASVGFSEPNLNTFLTPNKKHTIVPAYDWRHAATKRGSKHHYPNSPLA